MTTATNLVITADQYHVLAGSPPPIPTQKEVFEHQVALWATNGFGTEDELRRLGEYVPERGFFLLVPRRPAPLDLARLMSLVVLDGKKGVSYLDLQYLTDEVEVPATPYLCLGVEDGRSRLNVKPSVSRTNIANEGRSGYVALEAIAHAAAFPVVLAHHYIDAVGSRFNEIDVPCVYVDGAEPALDSFFDGSANPEWGAASCGSRVGHRA